MIYRHPGAMGPKLNDFHHYQMLMEQGVLTQLLRFPLALFRAACEFGFSRDSRNREFSADAAAAQHTSPSALARALVKVAGYSTFRAHVENKLFENAERLNNALNIPERLRMELVNFTSSKEFNDDVQDAAVPHPFDSHPALNQRIQKIGLMIPSVDYPAVLQRAPEHSWLQLIPDAANIGASQWTEFEKQFASAHEESLAYRYLPANEAEAAIVLQYFPNLSFPCKKEQQLQINYQGFYGPKNGIAWDQVQQIQYNDGGMLSADNIVVTTFEKATIGHKTVTIKFAIDAKIRPQVQEALSRYWQRNQVMRAQMKNNGA